MVRLGKAHGPMVDLQPRQELRLAPRLVEEIAGVSPGRRGVLAAPAVALGCRAIWWGWSSEAAAALGTADLRAVRQPRRRVGGRQPITRMTRRR
jgi:hypothetical protein